MRPLRIIAGVAAWAALAWGLQHCFQGRLVGHAGKESRLLADLRDFAIEPRPTARLKIDQPMLLAVGDPIFVLDGPDGIEQVGEIRRLWNASSGAPVRKARVTRAEALFYPGAPPLTGGASLTYQTAPNSLEWVLRTMLPPEKQTEIAVLLGEAFQQHQEEIVAALQPLVEDSLRQGVQVVEKDLAASLRRHRGELQALGAKYQAEIVQKDLVPLVKKEIWPVVRARVEPTAEDIGKEIWRRVSIWRFGWRYFYDKSPLPQKDLTRQEWKRFVDDEAMPVLAAHSDEFVTLVEQVLADAARNDEVRAVLRESLLKIVDDPELQTIVWKIIDEVIVDNPRLREAMARVWTSDEAKQAFRLAGERLEPTVREVGERLFGNPKDGISPEFARVLRNQILFKDRRWLVLHRPAKPSSTLVRGEPLVLQVRPGGGNPVNPFVPVGRENSAARTR